MFDVSLKGRSVLVGTQDLPFALSFDSHFESTTFSERFNETGKASDCVSTGLSSSTDKVLTEESKSQLSSLLRRSDGSFDRNDLPN